MIACPGCGGAQMAGHPAGRLAFQHTLSCPYIAAEDATQDADLARVWPVFSRPATDTEKRLVAAVDPGAGLDGLRVTVRRVTGSLRSRTWV